MIVNTYIFPNVNSLQDVMNTFFHKTSAAEKETLFHLKNVFGHRSVKKDVGETFNHAADFLNFVTHGYVLLATMELFGMEKLGDFQLILQKMMTIPS